MWLRLCVILTLKIWRAIRTFHIHEFNNSKRAYAIACAPSKGFHVQNLEVSRPVNSRGAGGALMAGVGPGAGMIATTPTTPWGPLASCAPLLGGSLGATHTGPAPAKSAAVFAPDFLSLLRQGVWP